MQIVSTLCDLCHNGGRDEPAVETVTVAVNKKAVELDVCQGCFDDIERTLQEVFEVGRRPGSLALALPKDRNKVGEFACDRCTRTFDSLQGLATHRSRTHGVYSPSKEANRKREATRARLGVVGPDTGMDPLPEGMSKEEAERLVDKGICLFDEDHGPFDKRSNYGTHLRAQHGVSLSSLGLARPSGAPAHKH